MAEQNLPIQSSAVRPEHCAHGFYETVKTSGSFSKETKHPTDCLLRRHALSRPQHARNHEVDTNSHKTAYTVGLYSQRRQISNNSYADDHLPRFHHKLIVYANQLACRESEQHHSSVSSTACSRSHDTAQGSTAAGSTGVSPASYLEGPPTLSAPPVTVNNRSPKQQQPVRQRDSTECRIATRTSMVGSQHFSCQSESNNTPPCRCNHFYRRFQNRLGSGVQTPKNQWQMVGRRELATYKRFGIESSPASSSSASKTSQSYNGQLEHGQLDSGCLHKSQRGNTLPSTAVTDHSAMELVYRPGYFPGCPSCPRQDQCLCRYRVKGLSGPDGLEIRSSNYPSFSVSVHHRPVRQQTDISAETIHQLETRSGGCGLRLSQCELEGTEGLCVPPFQPDHGRLEQGVGGPDRIGSGCANLASTAMVATPSKHAYSGAVSSSEPKIFAPKPNPPNADTPDVSTASSGRVSCLIQRYETEGLSRDVANLLVAATRSSTSKTYESSWKRWCRWCESRKVNPLSASLSDILSFFTDCYKEGLQYRSINVLRSALSSIHPKIDNYCIGQHPYVTNLLKGILNSRPPKPRYTHTWDLHLVTQYISNMGTNQSLSLKCLSWKLATLLAITCPKRVTSLASLDVNFHRVHPEGIAFTLTIPTKGTRPDETVQAFFARYTSDGNLCPVECLLHYLAVTKDKRRVEQGKPNRLFVSHIQPHGPVTKATICRWILSLLKEAGINTDIFKAHSIRGAATTAAANALVPLQDILDMADWSSASTFRQFYYKPVFSSTFGKTVLS